RRGPEAQRGAADCFGAAHPHRRRHGADQLAVFEDADLFGAVVSDRDMGVADPERHVLVLLAVEPVADRDAVEAGRDVDCSAGCVVLLGPPVGGLVVDPVPRPEHRWVRGDDEVAIGSSNFATTTAPTPYVAPPRSSPPAVVSR